MIDVAGKRFAFDILHEDKWTQLLMIRSLGLSGSFYLVLCLRLFAEEETTTRRERVLGCSLIIEVPVAALSVYNLQMLCM